LQERRCGSQSACCCGSHAAFTPRLSATSFIISLSSAREELRAFLEDQSLFLGNF